MSIEIAALSLIAGLNARIDELREVRLNSEPIDDLENLRALLLQFLQVLAVTTIGDDADKKVVDAAFSIRDGLKSWWKKDHVSICGKTFTLALFGSGLAICAMGGVLVPDTAMMVGALVGGKDVAAAIKAIAEKHLEGDD
jgi:hypothetical protein